jgi:hypothetical protein
MHMLKRWLNKLFAWWPWKQSAGVDKANPARDVGWSVPSDGTWRSTAHGMEPSTSQPGSRSIAVEQQLNNSSVDATGGTLASPSQPPQPLTNSNVFSSAATFSAYGTSEQGIPSSDPKQDTISNTELHLQFLRYLIQRGTFNDDLG